MAISYGVTIEIETSGLPASTIREIEKDTYDLQQWVANRIYQISQETVPVDTGYLKSTGQVTLEDGAPMVVYTADYAEIVEHGIRGTKRMGVGFLQGAIDEALSELETILPAYLPEGVFLESIDVST